MEFDNNVPIYYQVVEDIKRMLLRGELKPGDKLLSARDMALFYQINPNTAARVYKELEQQGLCFTKRGMGTYLTESQEKIEELRRERAETFAKQCVEGILALGFSREELQQMIQDKVSQLPQQTR